MPNLAHTATSSGPNTEILLLGGGMVVLALVFFFQKSASRQVSLVLGVLGAVAITGAFTLAGGSSEGDGSHDHGVSIAIASPADGATVSAGDATVEIDLEGGAITGDGAGHVHVTIDDDEVVMASSLDVDVELDPGQHEIEAEYVDADHQPLDPPVTDSVTVTAE